VFLRRSMTGSYSDFQFFASDLHVAHPPEGARRWRATSPARRQRASYMLTGGHMLMFPVRIREFWRMRRPRDVRTRAEPHVKRTQNAYSENNPAPTAPTGRFLRIKHGRMHRLLTIATSAHGVETSRLDPCRHDVSWAAPGAHVRRRMRHARAREPSIFL